MNRKLLVSPHNALTRAFGSASIVLALCVPLQALSWGTEGHQVIAKLAEAQLTPQARTEVTRLLGLEPGSTMTTISTWADEHRNPATAPWHYLNFPRGDCSYDASRDCPDGKCVVGAIERQVKVLASAAPDENRLLALKYIIHFVGDVHQPLHAGYGDDRGGNTYQLQAFMRGSNLHAVWDTGLIKALNEDADVVKVAEESCRIVSTPGFYPERLVDVPYIEKYTPVLENRLALAVAMLASLLNQLLR